MEVPFLDLKVHYNSIKIEIDAAIQKAVDSTALILGPLVGDLKKNSLECIM